jgi:hypothetical protein
MQVFHFLTNLALGRCLNFNPVLTLDGVPCDSAITPEEYVQFLGACRSGSNIDSLPGRGTIRPARAGNRNRDAGANDMTLGVRRPADRLTIGPWPRPSGRMDGRRSEPTFGSINDMTFDDVFASDGFNERSRNRNSRRACARCRLARMLQDRDATCSVSLCRARIDSFESFEL